MFRYNFWHKMLSIVYWFEWWSARSVTHIESKFFASEIDYHAQYDSWNDVLEYIHNVEDDEEEDDDYL